MSYREKWLALKQDGWYVCEVGGGWSNNHGPYRWRWIAAIIKIIV